MAKQQTNDYENNHGRNDDTVVISHHNNNNQKHNNNLSVLVFVPAAEITSSFRDIMVKHRTGRGVALVKIFSHLAKLPHICTTK